MTSDLRLDLVDVSCAGARTENVEYAPQQAEGTRPAQLDAVNPETALVTLTVGGNDVGYPRVLDDQACSTRSQCPGISPDEDGVLRELDTLDDKLVNTLYAITTKAPNATVLLVSYPQILPSSGETCDAVALTPDQARFSAAAAQQLDGA